MRRRSRIDWAAVVQGAGLALAVLIVTIVVVEVLDVDGGSNWVFLFYGLALGGLAAGAWLAARRRPDASLVHGLLAALGAYAVVVVVAVVGRGLLERGQDAVALAFNALMAASAGILGTLLAERSRA